MILAAENQSILQVISAVILGGGFVGCGVLWYFMVYKGSKDDRRREELERLDRAFHADDAD